MNNNESNNESNNDSLSSMNDLFGTDIRRTTKEVKKEDKIDDLEYKDIPLINQTMTSEEKKESEESKKLDNTFLKNDEINKKEEKSTNKFINENYINKDNDAERKPLVEVPENNNGTNEEGTVNELIDIAKNFDFSKVKFNIALIGFLLSLIGSILYNLLLTVPGLACSAIAYDQTNKGKLSKQDKLIAILGVGLSIIGLISIVISYITRIINGI